MEILEVIKEGFEKWLKTLGYAESTVYASSNYVRDFFIWLEKRGIKNLNQINASVIQTYYEYLQKRSNKKRDGSLSNNYIISNINALKRLSKYLEQTKRVSIEIDLRVKAEKENTKTILTQTEIKMLYKACTNDLLGLRDRAMLGVFYGCALRRSEGQALNLSDVMLKEKRIYVRKAKNLKERYVPMAESVKEDLENYIYVARKSLVSNKNENNPAFFLSLRSSRLSGNGLIERLHILKRASGIEKEIGLHTLRHSIATHLLQSGMKLEEVSQFLGHQSMESTQIYTHLAYE